MGRSQSLLLVILSIVLLASSAWAQMGPPENATVSAALNKTSLVAGESAVLAVVIEIPSGYYTNSSKPLSEDFIPTSISLESSPHFTASPPVYPTGEVSEVPFLGMMSKYRGRVVVYVPMQIAATAPPTLEIRGTLTTQICDERGTCYMPTDQSFAITANVLPAGSGAAPANAELFAGFDASAPPAPTTPDPAPADTGAQFSDTILGLKFSITGLYSAIAIGFTAGFLLNLMPCVLPVLPLKAMGFYEAAGHRRGRTLAFGVFFMLGTVALFSILGLLIVFSQAIFGEQASWGQQFSSPIFMWAISLLLLGLGVTLLAGYSLNLPGSFYGINFRHDTLSGNFLWGGFTGILSTPCTAPLLPMLIGWAILQPKLTGMVGMVSVGAGMGFPYLVLSAFPGLARGMPRTGPLGEVVKQMMGFLLLGSAAFFAGSRLFSGDGNLWLVAAVGVWAGLFLVARSVQLFKTSGAMMASTAAAALIAGVPIYIAMPSATPGQSTNGGFAWVDYSPEAFDSARANGQTVLVKFTANWCANCKVVERVVFSDPRTIDALRDNGIVAMKLDVDKAGWDLHRSIAPGKGIPLTAIYTPGNDRPAVLEAMYTTDTLLATIKTALAPARASR